VQQAQRAAAIRAFWKVDHLDFFVTSALAESFRSPNPNSGCTRNVRQHTRT